MRTEVSSLQARLKSCMEKVAHIESNIDQCEEVSRLIQSIVTPQKEFDYMRLKSQVKEEGQC